MEQQELSTLADTLVDLTATAERLNNRLQETKALNDAIQLLDIKEGIDRLIAQCRRTIMSNVKTSDEGYQVIGNAVFEYGRRTGEDKIPQVGGNHG